MRYFTKSRKFLKISVHFVPNNVRLENFSCFLCINLNIFCTNGDILNNSHDMLNLKCMKNNMNTLNSYFDIAV